MEILDHILYASSATTRNLAQNLLIVTPTKMLNFAKFRHILTNLLNSSAEAGRESQSIARKIDNNK